MSFQIDGKAGIALPSSKGEGLGGKGKFQNAESKKSEREVFYYP